MKVTIKYFLVALTFTLMSCSDNPQQADPDFTPRNTAISFTSENSPVVLIDEAHNNFLTMSGRYRPFAQVLQSDGFTVKASSKKISLEHLKKANVIVIANALDKPRRDWHPPFTYALADKEVDAIKQWVSEGGALFLVADHTPFPKVVENLALAFGFAFSDGHVDNAVFQLENNTLAQHIITSSKRRDADSLQVLFGEQGLIDTYSNSREISQVKSFGGSAFQIPEGAESLLTLDVGIKSIEPDIPFKINASTERRPVEGWSQGAVLQFGKGRIAVFAEGMMFSSQVDTKSGKKYGFTSPGAEQNEQFLLNTMHWLVRGELIGKT